MKTIRVLTGKLRRRCVVVTLFLGLICCFSLHAQIVTTIAGTGTLGYSGDGGLAISANMYANHGIASDAAGNLYFCDNRRIRKISASGIISTVAGNGTPGSTGDGGPATNAQFMSPFTLAIDGAGNLYIADVAASCIRKVSPSGVISAFAGNGISGFAGDGGPATAAQMSNPQGIAVDNSGNVYFGDMNNFRIRKINTAGIISTISGNGIPGYVGDGAPALAAYLGVTFSMATDPAGNIYFTDKVGVRKISVAGIISRIAGYTVATGYGGDGGLATAAQFNDANGIALDAAGNIYVADSRNERIRRINTSGIIYTYAGNGTIGYTDDNCSATNAVFSDPIGLAIDGSGSLYVTDGNNHRIREISVGYTPAFPASSQNLNLCSGAGTTSVNGLLAITDADMMQTLTWSVLTAPAHGTLAASYTTTSTGATITPTGLSYTPATGYTGIDSFKVAASDCAGNTGFTTVHVSIDVSAPAAGVISGTDSVCPGNTVTLANATAGGAWSVSGTGIASIGTGTGIVTGVTPGTETIRYIVANGCGADTAFFVVTVEPCYAGVATTSSESIETLQVYPNPGDGTFTVFLSADATKDAYLTVTNATGEKLKELPVATNKVVTITLDVPSGVYFLNAVSCNYTQMKKIVVVK